MGNFLHVFNNIKKKEARVLLLGLDNAGQFSLVMCITTIYKLLILLLSFFSHRHNCSYRSLPQLFQFVSIHLPNHLSIHCIYPLCEQVKRHSSDRWDFKKCM